MKIAFVWDWDTEYEQSYSLKDGLIAAVRELSKRHDVKYFAGCKKGVEPYDDIVHNDYMPIHIRADIKKSVAEFNPDIVLMWADATRPNAQPVSELGLPMALCFSGGSTDGPTARYFDHFFVESAVYYDRMIAEGKSVSRAFGTNCNIFKPIKQPKLFDVSNFSTFCEWKRHRLLTDAVRGLKTLCAGWMYPDHEMDCWGYPQSNGIAIAPHLPAEAVAHFINMSKLTIYTSTAQGGSQRSVLESLACGVPCVVTNDSDKTSEYVQESGAGLVVDANPEAIRAAIDKILGDPALYAEMSQKGIDYIQSRYSHIHYANAIEQGLTNLLNARRTS